MGVAIGNAIVGYYDCDKCGSAGNIGKKSCTSCDRRYRKAIRAIAVSILSIASNLDAPAGDILRDVDQTVADLMQEA